MFTYVCLGTDKLERAAAFYDAVLAPLGLSRCNTSGEVDWQGWAGWGTYLDGGQTEIALWLSKQRAGRRSTNFTPLRSHTAAKMRAHLACGRSITLTSTPLTYVISMATN